MLNNCRAAAGGTELAAARSACLAAQQRDPNNEEIKGLLVTIENKRKAQEACAAANALLDKGDDAAALGAFSELQRHYPGTCDAEAQITVLRDRIDLAGVLKQCQEKAAAGDHHQVIDYCEQVRSRNTRLEAAAIAGFLNKAYKTLGKEMVQKTEPAATRKTAPGAGLLHPCACIRYK